ncbi:hypothetical protein DSLPV1_112 [Dishui lake phycodnavirus 1]|uniref:hypothetical protein n=1 Tax=Dishui lake phycodnavirus 1 TaxID=2079134 RepID=UPI000CD6AA06|nr:hypothetical protein C5Y57_gp112 [Dishui lake phycodnavirus 1]AUT19083.1 hypothetical protein DSLPV1_112 [Dishui lake phycodnavirus 1]
MDTEVYSQKAVDEFMKKNFFFDDPILEKYYEANDVGKFRKRLTQKHGDETLQKMLYVYITDSLRDIILKTVGDMTAFMKPMADVVISGGEAFNMHLPREDRIVTSDIDTKICPRIPYNNSYFGKLQSIKLILWDKLGRVAKSLGPKVQKRLEKRGKLGRFLGVSLIKGGVHVTRRYTLIKKKKGSNSTNKASVGDVLIDVELFALDLNLRYFDIKSGRVKEQTLGGLLDMPLMRPGEFGYEIVDNQKKGVTYKNKDTNTLVHDQRVYIGGKRFLLDDVYEMQKLGLRPEKLDKDKKRMIILAKFVDPKMQISNSNSIDTIYKRTRPKVPPPPRSWNMPRVRSVNVEAAARVNVNRFAKYTTAPNPKKVFVQMSQGIVVPKGKNVPAGYEKTNGALRFDVHKQKWVKNNSRAYIGNQYTYKKTQANGSSAKKSLYGYRGNRNKWVPKAVLRSASEIPFVGLKNSNVKKTS